jgi:hypothetical protein
MGRAFDLACEALGEFGRSEGMRERIAKLIIEAAKIGERDRDRLCARALMALTHPEPTDNLAVKVAEVKAAHRS